MVTVPLPLLPVATGALEGATVAVVDGELLLAASLEVGSELAVDVLSAVVDELPG